MLSKGSISTHTNAPPGNLDQATVATILAVGPSFKQLKESLAWALGGSDLKAELESSCEGAVAYVYNVLTQGQDWLDDQRSPYVMEFTKGSLATQ